MVQGTVCINLNTCRKYCGIEIFLPQLLPFGIPCLWRFVPLKALSSPEFRLGAEMARRIELVATELGCSYVPLYEARKKHTDSRFWVRAILTPYLIFLAFHAHYLYLYRYTIS